MIWILPVALGALVGAWYRPVSVDEGWSLVVARRMNRGDRLYRDVFYGAAPLAIWIQAVAFRISRSQGIVVRLLTIVYIVAEIAAGLILVDGRAAVDFSVAGLMLAFGGVHLAAHNHYSHLSATAVLWAAVSADHGRPVLTGCLVGVAVLGRYSVGILATAAFGVHAWAVTGWTSAAQVVTAATVPAIAAFLVRPSAVRWFIRRAVANKVTYVATGGMYPLTWVRSRRWKSLNQIVVNGAQTASIMIVTATAVVTSVAIVADRDGASIGFVLTLVAASVVYPRFDGPHAVAAMPLAAPALVMAVPGDAAVWVIGGASWMVALLGLAAQRSATVRAGVRRDLPSLRHLPVTPLAGGVWPDETADLPREVFVLRMDAALVYACGGVTNPTPFDYPAVSTFGATGEREVLDAFARGLPVCDGWRGRSDPLTPVGLLDALPSTGGRPTRLGRLIESPP